MAGLSASRWAKKAAELKDSTPTNTATSTDKSKSESSPVSPSKNDRPVSSSTVSVFSEKDSSESDSDVDHSSMMSPAAKAFAARLSKPETKKDEEPHTPNTSPRKTLSQSRWASKGDLKAETKAEKKIDPKDVPLISTPPKGPASEYKRNGTVSANDLRARLAPPSAPVAPFETVPEDVAKKQRRDAREKEREAYRQKKMGHTREWDDHQTQPQHNGHNHNGHSGHNGHNGFHNEPRERRNSRNGQARRDSMNHHKPDNHHKLDARFEKKSKGRLPERQERPERPAPKRQVPSAPAKTAAPAKPKEPTEEEKEALSLKFDEYLKLAESKNFAWDDDEEDDMWA
ncbi:hypothetical protein CJU90_0159 [Yarrowia sp. C11]|nr:hypothetical protein CKK34_1570 [Yarrowia sp. E02]KAG5372517.1 hypothetical protein CJU90_0159 [Yarrowia sp. C11]